MPEQKNSRRSPLRGDVADFGFPRRLWRALDRYRPPGFGRSRLWRSPLRGPWLTSIFGVVLLVGLPAVALTGLTSYIAYGPQFGQAMPAEVGWLRLPGFDWPTRPVWLYRLNQASHVGLGLVLIPVVLAKLWSVAPKLLSWPPSRSVADILERLSLVSLVGSVLFEIATGVLNIQYDYVFGFNFYPAHYFGGWVFLISFVVHITLKLPRMISALRSRSLRAELRTSRAGTHPEPIDDQLVAHEPADPTLSRRGALLLVAGGSALVGVLTIGQTTGGFTRRTALLLPRGRTNGSDDFPVNRTASAAGVESDALSPQWSLSLFGGPRAVQLDLAALHRMPQHTATLPVACVEGWSTTQHFSGVRLADLAALASPEHVDSARVKSLERVGSFNQAILRGDQVLDPDALLALRVNGADLSLDHGFPARIIVPALPGVHNTKWVSSIEFRKS